MKKLNELVYQKEDPHINPTSPLFVALNKCKSLDDENAKLGDALQNQADQIVELRNVIKDFKVLLDNLWQYDGDHASFHRDLREICNKALEDLDGTTAV